MLPDDPEVIEMIPTHRRKILRLARRILDEGDGEGKLLMLKISVPNSRRS
jgi:hypothetical protein